ncbi:MAG: sugar-binding protein [Planctomycetota bacterium]
MRAQPISRFSHMARIVLVLVAANCWMQACGGEAAAPKGERNLVQNASIEKLDEYGLPEGFTYRFEAGKDGDKPLVDITVETNETDGGKCLKMVSKNGKGVLRVVLPVDLSGQPKSDHRYFLISWRARTSGDAGVYLDVDNRREFSSRMQSEGWITACAALEKSSPVTGMCLMFEARKPGDAAWIASVSVVMLSDVAEYRNCFVNNIWRVVPDGEIPSLPADVREGPSDNIIANSSFELGPYSGKQLTQTLRYKGVTHKGISSEEHYHGEYAAESHRFQTIYYRFEPEKLHTVSVYAKGDKEGQALKMSVRSGFQRYLGYKPWNPDAAEAQVVFPVTTEWKRYSFSFIPAPDPDRDALKPMTPTRPDQKELWLMMMTPDGALSYRMNPQSALKVVMDEASDNGRIWVDALQFEQGPLTAYHTRTVNSCGVILERSDTSDFCYYDDRPIKATGRVFTEDKTPRALKLVYRITDFFGREVKKIERTANTEGRNSIDDEVEFGPPGRGLQMITMTVSDPESGQGTPEATSMQQAFCAVSPEPRKRPFDDKAQYGIHTNARRVHMEGWENVWPNEYERMRKLGVKWVRYMGNAGDTLSWAYVEPGKGKWQWDDATLDAPAQKEFCILGSLYTVPSWLGGGYRIAGVSGHWDEWEEYVFQTVNHYKERIKYWEIWNEPDWDTGTYSEMMKRASRATRRADPAAKLLGMGGFSHVNQPKNVAKYKTYYEEVIGAAGADSMDGVAIHGYYIARPEENWWPLSERLDYLRGESRKRGKELPLWDTEACSAVGMFYTDRVDGADNQWNRGDTGTAVDPNIGLLGRVLSPRDAGNWMAQMLAVYLAHGCEKFFYHFNACAGGGLMDGNAGVLYEYDDSPKAHWAAWAAVALMLDRSTFVTEIKDGEDMRCYVYEREGVPTAAYWRLTGAPLETRPGTLTLACPKEKIEFFDIMSNPLEGVRFEQGGIVIPLTSDLAYIRGKGLGIEEFVDVLKQAKRAGPVQELIDWSSITKPRAKAEPAKPAVNRQESPIVDCPCAANIRIDGNMDDWQGRKAFTIGGPSQVVIGRPVEGMSAGLQLGWKSDDDLSAQLWTAWDEDSIYWAALVTDDMVVENKYRGKPQAYEGDSIEVFLDVRERADQSIPEYDERVGQIGVTPATREHPEATVTPASRKSIVSDMKASSSVTESGYFVEGAIPVRRFLAQGLKKDQVIGFDFAVDDTDGASNRKTQMIWAGTADACSDASVFGRLRLVD